MPVLLAIAWLASCADSPTESACDAIALTVVDVVIPTTSMVVGESRALTYRGIQGCDPSPRALHTFEVAGLVSDSMTATPARILRFNGQQILRAVDTGRVTLRIPLGLRDTTVTIDVGPPLPVARLTLRPMTQAVSTGARYRFAVTAYDSLDRELPSGWMREPISWSSPDSFVVVRGDSLSAYFTGTYPVTATWARGTIGAELRVQAQLATLVRAFAPPIAVGDTGFVSATGFVFNTLWRDYDFAREGFDAVTVEDTTIAKAWMTRFGAAAVVGLRAGQTVVTARMGAYSGSTFLTVSEPSP